MKLSNLILSNNENITVKILLLSGVAWLPLFLLTFIDGTLLSSDITIPFIKDVIPSVRGLVAIPLLVLADNVIEPMMASTLRYLQTSGLVPDTEKEHVNNAAERMAYQMNSKWMQILLVVLAIMISWMLQSDYVEMWAELEVTSWVLFQENGVVDETLAGTWFLLVTSPLVSFLLYRWVWRLIVWSLFLFRVSRLDLNLYASHTDLAGGLGVIGRGQSYFGIVFVVLGTLLSSDIAENILYEGGKLLDLKQVVFIFIFILMSLAVVLMPLLFFTKKLFKLKRTSLIEYSVLQHQISRDFHKHWIQCKTDRMVDSMQPSAMADYSAVYVTINNMRLVPLDPKTIIILAIILLLPFLPLALTQSSIWEILYKIGSSLV